MTGASRGIGEAIARAFAARGATLGLLARKREPLDELAAQLAGDGHVPLVADVTDPESVAAAVTEFGDVDVVVANAGITHYRPFAQLPLDEARHMNDVNWLGTIYTVWTALPGMIERGRGHIVVVSSGGGVRGFPSAAVYNGTKAAQRGFAEALRHELHGTGVSVTTVYPGEIATSLHDHELDHMPDWYRHGPPRAGGAARRAGGRGGRERPARALLSRRSCACCGSRTGSRRGSATWCSGASSAGARRRDDASAEAAGEAAAREVGEGAARGRRVVLRAEVRRLPDDRLPRRRRRAAPEPQRQADEPLLPGRGRAGARAAARPARARRRDDRRGRRRAGVRPPVAADPSGRLARGAAAPGDARRAGGVRPAGRGRRGALPAPLHGAPRAARRRWWPTRCSSPR